MLNLKTLFIGFLFLTMGTAYGQTSKFEVGVEAGPNIVSLRGNDVIDSLHKATTSSSAGLFFQYNLNKTISLRTNISFERKGSVAKVMDVDLNGDPIGELTVHENFDYLTVPILARATFGKRMKYFVNAGPYFGFLLKQTEVRKGDHIPTTTDDQTSLNKRIDIGISTGLGVSVPIASNFLVSAEVRNNLGLINTSAVHVYNDGTIKTNSTNFLVGFTYQFGQF